MARRLPTPAAAQPTWQRETPEIMALLFQQHPNAFTELDFRTPFELLVATILSAQSTDRRVNEVTPALFAKYPDAAALAQASPPDLEREIKTTGFFRMKAKALIGMSQTLISEHGGEVPARMEALVDLPGVGRKTANVVLGHALGVPGLPVDRHVLRVANRIGIAHAATPEEVEAQLCAAMPRDQWTLTSDTLILHGRRICRPRPLCEQCAVVERCDFARSWKRGPHAGSTASATASAPGPSRSPATRQGRARAGSARPPATRTAKAPGATQAPNLVKAPASKRSTQPAARESATRESAAGTATKSGRAGGPTGSAAAADQPNTATATHRVSPKPEPAAATAGRPATTARPVTTARPAGAGAAKAKTAPPPARSAAGRRSSR